MPRTPVRRISQFSTEDKARIVAEIRRGQAEGWGLVRLCQGFGISESTYRSRACEFPIEQPRMVPVEVVAAAPPAGVLLSPQGYRVEGLSVADLAQLLRLLA